MPLILSKAGTFALEEKRSKFIGYCAPVKTSEEALNTIEEVRKRNRNASHNVFAYSISACNTIRFSDDGEPHNTAGMPVLNVFQKAGIIDFVCVVTRYFGGTLLGAGGLVRAYTKTAKGSADAAGTEEQIIYKLYRVTCAYDQLDKMKYQFDKWGIEILDIKYTDHCEALVQVQESLLESFLRWSKKDNKTSIFCLS